MFRHDAKTEHGSLHFEKIETLSERPLAVRDGTGNHVTRRFVPELLEKSREKFGMVLESLCSILVLLIPAPSSRLCS